MIVNINILHAFLQFQWFFFREEFFSGGPKLSDFLFSKLTIFSPVECQVPSLKIHQNREKISSTVFSPILYRFISLIISLRNFCAEKLEFSMKISKLQKYTRFQVKWSFDIWRMYNPTSDEFGKKFLNGVLTRVFLCSRLILNRKTLAWTHATYENAKKHSY